MARFAAPIFLSAFLLFLVQPLLCKWILPWFGGSAAVWSTCIVFFQVLLFGGYLYAHLLRTYASRRTQAWIHTALLVASLIFLPLAPAAAFKPTPGSDAPTFQIVLTLLLTCGLPFFALSANGPLLQAWFSQDRPGVSPYRLYSLSNAGSLLALGAYPFLIEPILQLQQQSWVWSGLFVLFLVLCAKCAFGAASAPLAPAATAAAAEPAAATAGEPAPSADAAASRPYPSGFVMTLWVLLAACSSALLVATTNQLSQDVAVVPFLWVLPLSLYLISFIATFESGVWYRRGAWGVVLAVALSAAYYALKEGVELSFGPQILIYSGVLLTGCMICHGELVRLQPEARHLTKFYLSLSLGGALGGIAVTFVAPAVFTELWEYPVALLAVATLFLVALLRDPESYFYNFRLAPLWLAFFVVLGGFSAFFYDVLTRPAQRTVEARRNFYGTLKVNKHSENGGNRVLMHGRIKHGIQYDEPGKSGEATSYYGVHSGLGVAIRAYRYVAPEKRLQFGAVGLGTGTVSVWTEPGEHLRFYEINPQVRELAQSHFTYMKEAKGTIDVVLGDARLTLEAETRAAQPPAPLDILILDAFTGDAIPLHLLTRESFNTYWKRLDRDGILCVHISNRYLNLHPLVLGLAQEHGKQAVVVEDSDGPLTDASTWVLVTSNDAVLQSALVEDHTAEREATVPLVFTDDYSNLFKLVKW